MRRHRPPHRAPGAPLLALSALGLAAACTSRPDLVAMARERPLGAAGAGAGATPGGGAGAEPAGAGQGGGGAGRPGAGLGGAGGASPAPLEALALVGDLETHDSSVIESNGRYYLFRTGEGLPYKVSDDLRSWQEAGVVFDTPPAWVGELVPDATGLWAPDVERFGDGYHLYYAASTFGSGWSCIGHATSPALDPPAWQDQGPIVCSDADGVDVEWDAIDPSVLVAPDGSRWLVFGSFGSGIQLLELDASGARATDELVALAARPEAPHAVQAPFLWYRAPYYYLFVTFDWCCRGVDSTSNLRVGRATALRGPYLDRDGVPLLDGGGTLLLAGDAQWHGVGSNTLVTTPEGDFNVFHSYDANAAGRATLRIAELAWDDDGWPRSGGP